MCDMPSHINQIFITAGAKLYTGEWFQLILNPWIMLIRFDIREICFILLMLSSIAYPHNQLWIVLTVAFLVMGHLIALGWVKQQKDIDKSVDIKP